MAEPWFDPTAFGTYYGGVGGSVLGSLGGLLGTLAGRWAPVGKGRSFVLGSFSLFAFLGFAQLCAGAYAIVKGQPWAIWYPLVLIGGICAFLFTMLKPVVRRRYDKFELKEWVNSDPPAPRLD